MNESWLIPYNFVKVCLIGRVSFKNAVQKIIHSFIGMYHVEICIFRKEKLTHSLHPLKRAPASPRNSKNANQNAFKTRRGRNLVSATNAMHNAHKQRYRQINTCSEGNCSLLLLETDNLLETASWDWLQKLHWKEYRSIDSTYLPYLLLETKHNSNDERRFRL